MENSPGQA